MTSMNSDIYVCVVGLGVDSEAKVGFRVNHMTSSHGSSLSPLRLRLSKSNDDFNSCTYPSPPPTNLSLHPLLHFVPSRHHRRATHPPHPPRRPHTFLRRRPLPSIPRRPLGLLFRHLVRRPGQQRKVRAPIFIPTHLIRFRFRLPVSFSSNERTVTAAAKNVISFFSHTHTHTHTHSLISASELSSDAAKVMAAVAVSNSSPRLSTLKESPFLPSVSDNSRQII